MTKSLLTADASHIWHPYTSLQSEIENLLIQSAKGVYIYDQHGNAIIDAISSWWVNIHGHGNTKIAEAIYEQALNLEHVIFAGFTHEPAIRLSSTLIKILPGNQKRIFFSDNGSTAVEVAIKMALQYWYNLGQEKIKIIAIEGAYHGDTFGAMSVAERTLFTEPFRTLLFKALQIPFPDGDNDVEVIGIFNKLIEQKDIAAFIYEPLLQGAAGMRTYSAETLHKLLSLAKEKNVICIADEVLTGFGRTEKLFASNYVSIPPDIITLSKAITGGVLPLGVTACCSTIEEAFLSRSAEKTFYHGHSYTGNPIACAAANASLEILLDDACQASISRIAASHKYFAASIRDHKKIRKLYCIGTLLSIEVHISEPSNYFHSARDYIYNFFLVRNILIRPLGNTIYILPPYVISDKELEQIYSAIEELLLQL